MSGICINGSATPRFNELGTITITVTGPPSGGANPIEIDSNIPNDPTLAGNYVLDIRVYLEGPTSYYDDTMTITVS